jgi:putative zinc finger/helix-turn-helix YgiT family protein
MKTKPLSCASCGSGHYQKVLTRYVVTIADGVEVVVPNAELLKCQKCGDELIPSKTQALIDQAIADQTEQLSKNELEDIADRFGLDQTQISETLGLGSKTFHRWLNGSQYPSRSMGYYLRILAEFPEAFDWLKRKGWRRRNRVFQATNINLATQFPDLARYTQINTLTSELNQDVLLEIESRRFNPASCFTRTKVL